MARNERRSLLLVGCDYAGLLDMVYEGICKYTAYETTYFNFYRHQKSFYYRSFGHRATNFLLKHTAGLNLKDLHYDLSVTDALFQLKRHYDVILVHRPDLLNDNHLSLLRERGEQMLAVYWDSVERFPRKLQVRQYFDQVFSYDPANCMAYGFTLLPHFLVSVPPGRAPSKYDIYGLSNRDNRFATIEHIASQLASCGIICNLKACSGKPFTSRFVQHTDMIPYPRMLAEVQQARAILDVQQPRQTGLSFRPFEAIGMSKKLVTTNPHIRDYDFYHPDNVCLIEPNNVQLDPGFFNRPYHALPAGVLGKYHLKNWVGTLLPSGHSLFPVPAASGNIIYRSLGQNTLTPQNRVAG